MLDARSRRPSFFNADQIFQHLFPTYSFWHRFQELIYTLITDEDCACVHCPDRGRPAKFPALLAMVNVLQRRENLSGREVEDRIRCDRLGEQWRRARYRGLRKVSLQCLFTALAVNIKRWFRLLRARVPALSPA